MNFAGEYARIGAVDPAAIRTALGALPESAWLADNGRQQAYRVHAQTQMIPLIFDPDMRHPASTEHPHFSSFEPLLRPVTNRIMQYYKEHAPPGAKSDQGYFARIILVRLAGGSSIGSHRDNGYSLSRAHRIHFPIITSEKAVFGISGIVKHLAAGEIWEINNRKPHAVRNESPEARVHAIFDYVIPGEQIGDPDGPLVA